MNRLHAEIQMSQTRADVLCTALMPEIIDYGKRAKVELSPRDWGLEIKIKADDMTALRAATNTYLRWIIMNLEVLDDGNAKTDTG